MGSHGQQSYHCRLSVKHHTWAVPRDTSPSATRFRPGDGVHVPHVCHDVAELVLKSVGHLTAESLPVVDGESPAQKRALDARFARQQEIGTER